MEQEMYKQDYPQKHSQESLLGNCYKGKAYKKGAFFHAVLHLGLKNVLQKKH